jgi:hypothetical protein
MKSRSFSNLNIIKDYFEFVSIIGVGDFFAWAPFYLPPQKGLKRNLQLSFHISTRLAL